MLVLFVSILLLVKQPPFLWILDYPGRGLDSVWDSIVTYRTY